MLFIWLILAIILILCVYGSVCLHVSVYWYVYEYLTYWPPDGPAKSLTLSIIYTFYFFLFSVHCDWHHTHLKHAVWWGITILSRGNMNAQYYIFKGLWNWIQCVCQPGKIQMNIIRCRLMLYVTCYMLYVICYMKYATYRRSEVIELKCTSSLDMRGM